MNTETAKKFLREALELLDLPAGWNSYKSKPINPNALLISLGVIGASCTRDEQRLPSLVPLSSGGAQVVWHLGDRDVYVKIAAAPGVDPVVEYWTKDLNTGEEDEGELDLSLLTLCELLI